MGRESAPARTRRRGRPGRAPQRPRYLTGKLSRWPCGVFRIRDSSASTLLSLAWSAAVLASSLALILYAYNIADGDSWQKASPLSLAIGRKQAVVP